MQLKEPSTASAMLVLVAALCQAGQVRCAAPPRAAPVMPWPLMPSGAAGGPCFIKAGVGQAGAVQVFRTGTGTPGLEVRALMT